MDKEGRASFIRKQITSAECKKSIVSDTKGLNDALGKRNFEKKKFNADK